MENERHIAIDGQDLGYNFQTNENGPTILSFGLTRTFCLALSERDSEGEFVPMDQTMNRPEVVMALYKESIKRQTILGDIFIAPIQLNDGSPAREIRAERVTCTSQLVIK